MGIRQHRQHKAVQAPVRNTGMRITQPLARGMLAAMMAAGLVVAAGCTVNEGAEAPAQKAPQAQRSEPARQAQQPVSKPKAATPLKGTRWMLAGQDGKTLEGDNVPSLTLQPDSDGFGGHAGCNRYFGAYQIEGSRISLSSGLGMTKRMCEVRLMQRERSFLGGLRAASRFVQQGDVLRLYDDQGNVVARFNAFVPLSQ